MIVTNCRKASKKIEGGPFGGKKFEKNPHCPKKNWKGDPLVSPGIVCYAEKEEKPFWFSPLGHMIHFRTIKFRITFQNYFGHSCGLKKN